MTPRQADVAFVLEGLTGVRAAYMLLPGRPATAYYDFAVELEPGGYALATATCALLRVLTHDECARVCLFQTSPAGVVAEAAQLLHLEPAEREAARRRVPALPAPGPIASALPELPPVTDPAAAFHGLVLSDHFADVERVLSNIDSLPLICSTARDVAMSASLAKEVPFAFVLCDARLAFGAEGLLAKLPMHLARRTLVIAAREEVTDARWRLQGTERILTTPLEPWWVGARLRRVLDAPDLIATPNRARITARTTAARRVEAPPPDAPFTVLLVDVEDDVHEALRSIFREEARHLMRRDPEEAAEVALSKPFHLVVCSANAALHPRSFLDAVAREDPKAADRVLVVAPARDVRYADHKLAEKGRKNTVLALPIDEALLGREVFRDHPELVARVAIADLAKTSPASARPARYRRLAVLVVDDDSTTEILFAAASPRDDADVALATTAMEAFEHVVTRAVDLLVVSATMRGDGGEPFYRVLWRLSPELKGRTVLLAAAGARPSATPPPASRSARLLDRPLTSDALERVVRTLGSPSSSR